MANWICIEKTVNPDYRISLLQDMVYASAGQRLNMVILQIKKYETFIH